MIKDVTAVEDERRLLHRVKNTLEIERLELPVYPFSHSPSTAVKTSGQRANFFITNFRFIIPKLEPI